MTRTRGYIVRQNGFLCQRILLEKRGTFHEDKIRSIPNEKSLNVSVHSKFIK